MTDSNAIRSARLLALLDRSPSAIGETLRAAHPEADAPLVAVQATAELDAFRADLDAAIAAAHRAAVDAEHDLERSMHADGVRA